MHSIAFPLCEYVFVVLVLVVVLWGLPKDRDLEFGAWLVPPKLRFRVVHNGRNRGW